MKFLLSFFRKNISYRYFLASVIPRSIHEQSDKGGMYVSIKFEKTIKQFGKTKVLTEKVEFNNFHTHQKNIHGDRLFTYNPPYVPNEISKGYDDRIWHEILIWENCENYPFAPITTEQINIWLDEWETKNACFTCWNCNYQLMAPFTTESVICPSCKKGVGVPPPN